jgi:ABC-type Zn2+ transport system substrate-binding protein/surface adhesin
MSSSDETPEIADIDNNVVVQSEPENKTLKIKKTKHSRKEEEKEEEEDEEEDEEENEDEDEEDDDDDDDDMVADTLTDVGLYNVLGNFLSDDEGNTIGSSLAQIAKELGKLNHNVKKFLPSK